MRILSITVVLTLALVNTEAQYNENAGVGSTLGLGNNNGHHTNEVKAGVLSDPNEERSKVEKTPRDFLNFDIIQRQLKDILRAKPIVDTATDAEKNAPNTGSNLKQLGDFIVRGGEAISKGINSIFEGTKNAGNKLSQGASEYLNKLGAYISGL